jgi:hypothetical protein
MTAVTRVTPQPGDVIRLGRRVGVVLDDPSLVDVRVVAAMGVETWPLADIATSTALDTGTAYAVRALEQAKGAETMATKALTEYGDRFAQRKRQITKIAHKEGPGHGLGRGLDRLLSENGLDPRPQPFTRFVALLMRVTYTGTGSSLNDRGRSPLYADQYSITGRFVPQIAMQRVVVIDMPATNLSFNNHDQCTCEAEGSPDLPTRAQVLDRFRQSIAWGNDWAWEVLDHKMVYVSGQENCPHAARVSRVGTQISVLFPDAPSLTPVIEPEHDIKVGDVVEITEAHDGMEQGWRFTVTSCDYDEGHLNGTSPEHTRYEGTRIYEWSIEREYCKRVTPRIGERVYLTQDSLGLRQGQGLIVVAPPWQSPSGPRLSGTRVDLSDHFVYTVDAAHVRIDPLGGDAPF